MKPVRMLSVVVLVAAALWLARPLGLCSVYRGYKEGRATGEVVFSIVRAVGEHATRRL